MKLLSKEQRVSVLKCAKELYVENYPIGMCSCIDVSLSRHLDGEWYYSICNYIEGFSNNVASERFGATREHGYWWPRTDIAPRLEYFDWLIELNGREEEI